MSEFKLVKAFGLEVFRRTYGTDSENVFMVKAEDLEALLENGVGVSRGPGTTQGYWNEGERADARIDRWGIVIEPPDLMTESKP